MSAIFDRCCFRCLPQLDDIGLDALTEQEVLEDLSYPRNAETRGDETSVSVPRDRNRAPEPEGLEPRVR